MKSCCRERDDLYDAIDKVARALAANPDEYARHLEHFVRGPKLRALFAAVDAVRKP